MRALRALSLLFSLTGCFEEERACYPGDYSECTCDSGERGYAQCDPNGEAYGTCGFCGTTPGATPPAEGAGGGGGGELAGFLEVCEVNEDCESALCHVYQAKGTFCTLGCDGPEDCPAPSSGCNMMGVCKAP